MKGIEDKVRSHLKAIEQKHDVLIIHAIESGSRSWGFPSPDSDFDVRFIYAHPKDWYLQVFPQRDVIEVPISDELDIAGWDVKKAMFLAAKGNVVIHEWLNTPLVYQSNQHLCETLQSMMAPGFNPQAAYHHYRAMAKRAWLDIQGTAEIKLKRFFYFMRALLSASWILKHQSMPSVQFDFLLNHSDIGTSHKATIHALIEQKSTLEESEKTHLDESLLACVGQWYDGLPDSPSFGCEPAAIDWNQALRHFLSQLKS